MVTSGSRFSPDRIAEFARAYDPREFDRPALLADRYRMASDETYCVYYAPVAAWPLAASKIVFVGLSPGFSQMQIAARLYASTSPEQREDDRLPRGALRADVAFAGTMRRNLCSMLDAIGLACQFGVASTTELFTPERDDVATTSALVFPTFASNRNLSEIRPGRRIPIFDEMRDALLLPRLQAAPHALIVPLGKAVETLLDWGAEARNGDLDVRPPERGRILSGFPHPSGANGHRGAQFERNRTSLVAQIERFYGKKAA